MHDEVTKPILFTFSWNSEALHIKEMGATEDGEVPNRGKYGNMLGSDEPWTPWEADLLEGDSGFKDEQH